MTDHAPDALLSDAGLKSFTSDKRKIHGDDAMHYQQMADQLSAHLSQHHIDGDGSFSAQIRAWRVSRRARKMSRLSNRIAKESQALYSTFHNHVTRVPEKRENKAQKELQKANKNQLPHGQPVNNSGTVLQFNSGNFLSPTPPPLPQQEAQAAITGEWNIYQEFDQQQRQAQ